MADINQKKRKACEKETNDSLRKEDLNEGDIVEIQREEDASEKKENSHNQWEINIKDLIINNQGHPLSHLCCIYRAHVLPDVDTAAFTPQIVSIGPLHHSQQHLKGMEETKIKYLEQFLQHAVNTARLHEQHQLNSFEERIAFLGWKRNEIERSNDFSCLGEFLSILKSSEKDIRSSYAENLNHIGSEEFLRLVLVDAAFIIELFLRLHFLDSEDTMLPPDYLIILITCDLWLLENQLPFFILEKLYALAFGSYPEIYPPFLDLTFEFFELYNEQEMEPNTFRGKVKHFTDLLRAFFLPSFGNFEEEKQNSNSNEIVPLLEHLPSATQLHAAGVKFIATESKCLLDIKFSNGRLEIPSLHLLDETAYRFRNLIALEQYHYPDESIISDYFTLMDYLLDTSKDADLLVENKIIKHWLGSNSEVASLFNSLCINIIKGMINRDFFNIILKLNEYHSQPWHSWKATLRKQYFSTPWRSASTTAAIILLALTLAQTILAVLPL